MQSSVRDIRCGITGSLSCPTTTSSRDVRTHVGTASTSPSGFDDDSLNKLPRNLLLDVTSRVYQEVARCKNVYEQLYSSASDREKNKKIIYNKHLNTTDVQDNQVCVAYKIKRK